MLLSRQKKWVFDENGENDESAFEPVKQGLCCSNPVKRRKWRKWRVSRGQGRGLPKAPFLGPRWLRKLTWSSLLSEDLLSKLVNHKWSSLVGSLAKGGFAEKSLRRNSAKYVRTFLRRNVSLRQERVRTFCGKFAESCKNTFYCPEDAIHKKRKKGGSLKFLKDGL